VIELKAKPGDLIKIIRKSDAAKESIYYRVVIEG
jgi:DNA-directed RNA polymerase subunit H (RpoH/RPB5)